MIDLRQGDCLEIMKNIPDKSIDLIVTDPPYKLTSRGGSGTMGGYWKEEKEIEKIIINNNTLKFPNGGGQWTARNMDKAFAIKINELIDEVNKLKEND